MARSFLLTRLFAFVSFFFLAFTVVDHSPARAGYWVGCSQIGASYCNVIFPGDGSGPAAAAYTFSNFWPRAAGPSCYPVSNGTSYECESWGNSTSCISPPPAGINFPCAAIVGHACYANEILNPQNECVSITSITTGGCEGCCTGSGDSAGASGSGSGVGGGPSTIHPIEIATGRKMGTYNDWTTGGVEELHFTRYYSSQSHFVFAPSKSILGPNWRSNFDSRVYFNFTGTPVSTPAGNTLHIALPDFGELAFNKVSPGVWQLVSPTFAYSRAYWNTLRTDLNVSLAETANSIILKTPSGIKYTYNFQGQLLRIEFSDGYAHNLEYAGDNLNRVIDSLGRVMSFDYYADTAKANLVKTVTLPDGRQLKFTYTNRLVLPIGITLPTTTTDTGVYALASVIYPDSTPLTDADNPTRTFEYLNSPDFPTALTGIFDENGTRYLTVTYDALGRANSSGLNGNAERMSLVFDDVNNKVTVTNELGRSTIYSFDLVFGSVKRLIAIDGVLTTNCAASNKTTVYDANGFKQQVTDGEGRVTKWVKDARGLPLSTTRGFGTASAVTTAMTWDPVLPLPATVTEPGITTTYTYSTAGLVTSISQQDTTTITVPYSTNGQTRATTFSYQNFTAPAPPPIAPTGTTLADLPIPVPNGDASGASIAPWTSSAAIVTLSTAAPCAATNACFSFQTSKFANFTVVAQQDIAVPTTATADIDAGRRAAKLSWRQYVTQTYDQIGMEVVFLSQSGTTLGSVMYPTKYTGDTWTSLDLTGPVPPLTRNIRIEILGLSNAISFHLDFIDDVTLTLIANGTASATPYLSIINPDGSGSGITGWVLDSGATVPNTACTTAGVTCFSDSTAGIDKLHQDIPIPADRIAETDSGARRLDVQWAAQSNSAFANIVTDIQFLNAANAVIANSTNPTSTVILNNQWVRQQLLADVPVGTRTIRLSVAIPHVPNGDTLGAYFTGITARLIGRASVSSPIQLLTTVDGPLAGAGDTTTFAYNTNGYLKSVTDPVGLITQVIAADAVGRPITIRNPSLVDTNLTYNERGWLTSMTVNPGAAQAVTTFAYDNVGQITKVTAPDGSFLQYAWTGARKIDMITNNTGETIKYTYNANNEVLTSTVKSSSAVITKQMSFVYDEIGRLLKSIGAASQTTTLAYDRTDLNTQVTDPRSNLYGYAYDGLSRLVQTKNEENAVVTVTPNAQDKVTSYQDPRLITTSYVRNGFGEVIQEVSPDAGTSTYVRDLRGLVTQATDGRGIVMNKTYDTAGRLLTEVTPAAVAENVTYAYDSITGSAFGKGRLTSITDQSGSTTFTYNALGQIVTDKRVIATKTYTTSYLYDAAGHVSQITYPSGRVVIYARNTLGQVTGVTTKQTSASAAVNVATGITYAPMSNLMTGVTHGNGLVTTATYDQDYRLSGLNVKNGAAFVSNLAYAYADGINLTGITDQVTATNSNVLSYTPANRLATATGPWGTESFTYDAVGNRLNDNVTSGATTVTRLAAYPTTSNRIVNLNQNAATFRTYAYDAGGNITSDTRPGETYVFTYNKRNRLSSLTRNAVAYATYGYNALEEMTTRSTSAVGGPVGQVAYIYDLDGHLIAEATASSGATTRDYIWLAAGPSFANANDPSQRIGANDNQPVDMPLAVVDGGTTLSYLHADHLGRPIKLTNAAKAVVFTAIYKPYGEVYSTSGTVANNVRFPGQYFQIETGFAYNWHRHYDPVTGRYTQPDPLRFVDGSSIYNYAGSSPLIKTDRDGQILVVDPRSIFDWLFPPKPQTCSAGPNLSPNVFAAPGNQMPTVIKNAWSNDGGPPDKCKWLSDNSDKFSTADIKAAEKVWGCRRSRWNRE